MRGEPAGDAGASPWRLVGRSLTRPYPVTLPMLVLVGLVPLYLVIARHAAGGPVHVPATPLDRLLPLVPASALVYGALYAFLIALPVFVIRSEELIRRTVWTYLLVWLTAYLGFLVYPTVAPRPTAVAGTGFGVWGLRFLYGADPPYNCFPSIHVAHSFVSAFAAARVDRRLGGIALAAAGLVALSTLLTKQHYILDVLAGLALASGAAALCLRGYSPDRTPDLERRAAPALAITAAGVVAIGFGVCWAAYRLGVRV